MSELLRTPRLSLRSWADDDLEAFYDVYSRWEVMRWLGTQPRRALADHEEAARSLARYRQVGDEHTDPHGLWAVVPEGAEHPVGTVLLLPLRDADGPTSEVEVGWHLHPDWQGRGLVTESARALLGEAERAGHHRVLAITDDDNVRSQAVAGRLGMVDEGLSDRWFGQTMRVFAWSPGKSPAQSW